MAQDYASSNGGYRLGYWINAQRERKRGIRSYSLDDEKVEKLNQIGMLRGLRSMCLREQDNIPAK
ncbi:helicase associated domain-containing protein [Robinsoniella peoriensis]|uniref:helicase associated domain-containing protein n=1 Tax=Robinsoniella peoriensis TaxID=180332 RepID=UPI0009DDC344|nr:helicase associated domain-containing protein [Robinsoniella peoriensis]